MIKNGNFLFDMIWYDMIWYEMYYIFLNIIHTWVGR